MPKTNYIEVGNIHNTYGGLVVFKEDGKFYMGIECEESEEGIDSEEISETLYRELTKHATKSIFENGNAHYVIMDDGKWYISKYSVSSPEFSNEFYELGEDLEVLGCESTGDTVTVFICESYAGLIKHHATPEGPGYIPLTISGKKIIKR